MHVLTTSLCYPTPVHRDQGIFVQQRARALGNLPGEQVRVIAPQLSCPLLRPPARYPDTGYPIPVTYPRMFSMPVIGRLTDGWAYARAIQRAILQWSETPGIRFDIIDAHFVYPDGVGAWIAGRKLDLPVSVTVRGKIVALSRRTIRRLQIQKMLRGVQARIAVSASLAAWVHRVAGSDLHVDVIPNGIDIDQFHLIDQDDAREALGWDFDSHYVLAVGHLQYLKGFDRLADVWPDVRRRAGDVRLVLAGSVRGERRFAERLNRTVSAVNRAARARVIDYVGTVPGGVLNVMYNAADFSVVASRSEGWCNAISESLAVGTPVVATDVGGNREQISSTELGRLVPDGDRRALTDAIVEALSARWNRVLISAHGSNRQWRHVAGEVREVFRRVLQQHIAEPEPADGKLREARRRLEADVMAPPWTEATP